MSCLICHFNQSRSHISTWKTCSFLTLSLASSIWNSENSFTMIMPPWKNKKKWKGKDWKPHQAQLEFGYAASRFVDIHSPSLVYTTLDNSQTNRHHDCSWQSVREAIRCIFVHEWIFWHVQKLKKHYCQYLDTLFSYSQTWTITWCSKKREC